MKQVLVADDEPSLRMLVSATLVSDELEVLEAGDGHEAWRIIREHRPALVLLDVDMPGRNGLDLARALKSDRELSGIKIIILTGRVYDADADAEAGRAAGADYYLTKPFSPIELIRIVEEALAAS